MSETLRAPFGDERVWIGLAGRPTGANKLYEVIGMRSAGFAIHEQSVA